MTAEEMEAQLLMLGLVVASKVKHVYQYRVDGDVKISVCSALGTFALPHVKAFYDSRTQSRDGETFKSRERAITRTIELITHYNETDS
jgi:hypothetical protein